ncbi:MAG: hypothetical protein ACLPT4_10015 [Verrucomicrobiia bacterium]
MFGHVKRDTQASAIRKYVDVILKAAVVGGVDKIIFGEPCDDLPRETCPHVDAINPYLPAQVIAAFNNTRDVAIWQRIDGTWHELPGFPWYLLHEVVRHIGDLITLHQRTHQQHDFPDELEATVPLELAPERGVAMVSLTLTMERNYCFSVTLKKLD